jgi:hypothetical protein
MNAGNKDVGIDPDWDLKNGVWKGRERRQQMLEEKQRKAAENAEEKS